VLAKEVTPPAKTYQLDLSSRGYQVLFWRDQVNHCPGCGKSAWHVGRLTAECGFCGTALSINDATRSNFELTGRKAVALHVIAGGKRDDTHFVEKRKHPREPAGGRTVMLHIDGTKHAFAIHDSSAGGMKGEALSGIARASSLVIELEDGTQIPAELRWSDGEFAGLAFLEPIVSN
jgi:hypothetical protein